MNKTQDLIAKKRPADQIVSRFLTSQKLSFLIEIDLNKDKNDPRSQLVAIVTSATDPYIEMEKWNS